MSEDDKILKFFRNYLTQPKIKQDIAQKILKYAEVYDTKHHRPKQFLDKFFDSLRKSFDIKNPKNFVTACKRFLFIIHKLLGAEVKREKQGRYNQLISEQIVRYYLFFFDLIFKHSLHELIVELKMYRMKWVRLISDHAFISLRQEVKKKHNNFNLDRGFSEENMEKLKKIHVKRGLTQKQSNFYLGLSETQQSRRETLKEDEYKSSESESEEERNQYQNGGKRVKPDNNQQDQPQPSYPLSGYANYTGYNQGYYPTSQIYQNQPIYQPQPFQTFSDPRIRKPSFNQTPYNPNPYPSMGYQLQKTSLDSTPQTTPSVYSISPSRSYPSYFSHPTYSNQPQSIKPQMNYEFREVPEPKKYQTSVSTMQKVIKMRKQLTQNLFKCRQCGQCFETGENHQKHMNQHFFMTLDKVNQAQLKGKLKKQNKMKLLDIKSWETILKSPDNQPYQFQVLLSELPQLKGPNVHCYFCNEEMEISFSQKYEDWVITDAIKINDEEKIDIIHFGCYESFKSDQNSPVEV